MDAYGRLIDGYKKFKEGYLSADNESWLDFHSSGQEPKVMVIACSDSRLDPAILTESALGDIFMVRSVANIVPPYCEAEGVDSTSAALEFAVNHLKVEHIIVLGHSGCGGVAAMMNSDIDENTPGFRFIKPWVNLITDAGEGEHEPSVCEKKGVLLSLENLASFPWIEERVGTGSLKLHGWYFDIASGSLSEYRSDGDDFSEVG